MDSYDHKRPYWAITDDDERLHAAYRLHRHHEASDEHYGEESLEELQTDEMGELDGRRHAEIYAALEDE
ncbi:MAG: hypothetical protein RI560_09020 [Natronomonas sp.]|nr:hypothetical protein [Natronomonas sp.]